MGIKTRNMGYFNAEPNLITKTKSHTKNTDSPPIKISGYRKEMTSLYDICSEVQKTFPQCNNVGVLKNAMAVIMDEKEISYNKDVSYNIMFHDKIVGEDTCDFIVNGIPLVIAISPIGYSEKSTATKIISCIKFFSSPFGIVILFKMNDLYHQPIQLRSYDASGTLISEFAGREPL